MASSSALVEPKTCFMIGAAVLLCYMVIMDSHLYHSLQSTTLANHTPQQSEHFSPFHPLTMKLLMTDPANHYVLTPLAEYFDDFTKFSKICYFITPNMISFTHLLIGLLSCKFVSSESLTNRRYGVLLFQVRTWLDNLDGVVYRSRTKSRGKYESHRATLGYFIDMYADTIGSAGLCFGMLFFLLKFPPSDNTTYSPLPRLDPSSTSCEHIDTPIASEEIHIKAMPPPPPKKVSLFGHLSPFNTPHGDIFKSGYTKQHLLFRVFLVGLLLAIDAASWDKMVSKYEDVFHQHFTDPKVTTLQTEALHSGATWFVIYLWRLFEGQALLQMILIAVFVDKIWDFVRVTPYIGYVLIVIINIISEVHIREVRVNLGIVSSTTT